eukprot:symbB.v1.2.038939.t1/scaffold6251.1/size19638/1
MRPQREQLKRCVEACLSDALAGHTIEVVGSTAWGGEVPQSDLDLVLVTPSSNSDPSQALVLLQSLEKKLESQTEAERAWARLELVEARKVPVLRLYDRAGLSCDVVVDQLHALEHRKVLKEALEGRPEVKKFIRLVKYWLRQRGLPMGSEGGLASFAWAYSALQLAMQLPQDSTVERLLFHFFKQMNLLSSMSLLVQKKDGGARVAFKPRKEPSPWAQEWIEFIFVEDPTRKHLGVRNLLEQSSTEQTSFKHGNAKKSLGPFHGERDQCLPWSVDRDPAKMSSGLLGNYESDEEDGEDLLKDGFAVRQAIAQQFASAADFEDEELNEPEGLPESVEADGYAQDSYQLDLDDEVDDNDLAEAIQEAQLQGDEDTVAGLHAEQERRKAAIDASVEMSAVSAVPDSMEDSNGPELEGDDETLERLRAEQTRRDARGEHARETGVRSATSSVSDSLEVPVQVIGAIIGTGGAKMNFEKEEYQPGYLPLSRCCLISGDADAVAKAKQLLQEAISAAMAEQGQGRKGKGGKGKGQRKGTPQNLASDLVGEGAGGRAGFQQGICKWPNA